uniref:NADP-dependent oxidoreductase domain-containing protein n=1 Tax=Branchiostoma floridae TaxID=7739 RepID=C3ZCA1_BRAFL|eukprot:XP_002593862.1 hypothetical protein BRAFLDRAFT_75678 [Branchiostoma floridae]
MQCKGERGVLERKREAEVMTREKIGVVKGVCLRWQVQRGVVVIPKSLRSARMVGNSQIFDFELSAGDVVDINSLNRDGRVYKWEWSVYDNSKARLQRSNFLDSFSSYDE